MTRSSDKNSRRFEKKYGKRFVMGITSTIESTVKFTKVAWT